jgi:signal peptidase II
LREAVPPSRYFVFFSLVVAGCALDLATKSWMFARLGMPDPTVPPQWVWKDVVGFQTSLNEGALFGMGQGLWAVFAALSLGAAVGIFYWLFSAGAARDWLLTIALAIVTAGILGNLYDRLALSGLVWRVPCGHHLPGDSVHAVRDFILVMIGPWHWPTFNLADSSLVCGAALLVFHASFAKTESQPKNEELPATEPRS